MSAFSVTLDVKLHRQDKDNLCGAACIQMIRQFDGTAIGLLDQSSLQTSAVNASALYLECLNPLVWGTCPTALEAGLTGLTKGDFMDKALANPDSLISMIVHGVTSHDKPSVILVDAGKHWLLVHGARSDGVNGTILDIRDSWPPRSKTDPHDVLVDCGADELAAASHLLFPAGLATRFLPASPRRNNNNDSRWLGLHVAVVSVAALSPPAGAAPAQVMQQALTSVTAQQAEQSALDAFTAMADLGWPPAVAETVKAMRTETIAVDEPHRGLAAHIGSDYIVELHRDGSPGHVVAMALVAGSGSFAGMTLEMISPAQGKSWLRPVQQLGDFLEQSQASLQSALGGEAETEAAVLEAAAPEAAEPGVSEPDPATPEDAALEAAQPRVATPQARQATPKATSHAQKIASAASGAWPRSLEDLPVSLRWLLKVSAKEVRMNYAWSSSADTRSPFHPYVRIRKDNHTALLMPNGRFRESPESKRASPDGNDPESPNQRAK